MSSDKEQWILTGSYDLLLKLFWFKSKWAAEASKEEERVRYSRRPFTKENS